MADAFRSDGKAVDVLVTSAVTKGDVGYVNGFAGIFMADAESGETVALDISQREIEITVAGGVSAAKGAILYIHADGTVDDQSASGTAFLKVTVAKDTNNVVWGIMLPQGAAL